MSSSYFSIVLGTSRFHLSRNDSEMVVRHSGFGFRIFSSILSLSIDYEHEHEHEQEGNRQIICVTPCQSVAK
jgi:hypothetical protein